MVVQSKIDKYIADWRERGYPDDIPDEVPGVLMRQNLAPSYKAIAHAILKNDLTMQSLGFTPKYSEWYGAFKRVEIENRSKQTEGLKNNPQVFLENAE
jgi:predicted phosphoadenosine phosphosulfate sulfurtransferase